MRSCELSQVPGHTTRVKVAIVEDDPEQRAYLQLCLDADYRVSLFNDATTFVRSLARCMPDILLLDWSLPDISGIDLVKQLRRQGHHLPVVVITARNDEDSLVTALEEGASDFIAKPVRPRELKARVMALSRRNRLSDEQPDYELGHYRLEPSLRRLLLDGQQVPLTNREFDLAALFFQQAGVLLHRETLLRSVWGQEDSVGSRTLDTHISRLRKKLKLNGEQGFQLRSVYQLGYRLEKAE